MKFTDLTMNNLKTKDLPIMMRIVKKLNLKDFLKESVDIVFNEDVPQDILDKIKDKEEAEQKKVIDDFKESKYIEVVTLLLNELIEGYDKVHDEIESLLGNVYNLDKKQVDDLDLDVTFECIYNLKEQGQLINFFKTALK